jgi:hypothetical protein
LQLIAKNWSDKDLPDLRKIGEARKRIDPSGNKICGFPANRIRQRGSRMNKRDLSERDICTKFITPAVRQAGWDEMLQIREEVSFTKGRIIVRGKLVTRGKAKRADYILYYKPNIPIAIIEAKDNSCSEAQARNQRARLLTHNEAQPCGAVFHALPEHPLLQTATQAIAALDAQFPWLCGAEKRRVPRRLQRTRQ